MVAASLTKPMFAYLVMQLVDEGKIGLDVPVADYLDHPLPSYPPEFPYPDWSALSGDGRWRSITPRMLLSHRSGLPNLVSLEPDKKIHIYFDPGSRFAYSGVGINLLQFVLEHGLGMDVDAELRHRVFQRFGMRDSAMTWQASSATNEADGYTAAGESRPHPKRRRAAAASSLDTTVRDYAGFVAGLVRGDGLTNASHQAMITSQGPIGTANRVSDLSGSTRCLATPKRLGFWPWPDRLRRPARTGVLQGRPRGLRRQHPGMPCPDCSLRCPVVERCTSGEGVSADRDRDPR